MGKLYPRVFDEQMTEFFKYHWQYNKNECLDEERDLNYLNKLPDSLQDQLVCGFLYSDFLHSFMTFFRIRKDLSKKESASYNAHRALFKYDYE